MSKFIVGTSTDVAVLCLNSLDKDNIITQSIEINTGVDGYFLTLIYVNESPTTEALQYIEPESLDFPPTRIHGILEVRHNKITLIEQEFTCGEHQLHDGCILNIPNGNYRVIIYKVYGEDAREKDCIDSFNLDLKKIVIEQIGEARFLKADKERNKKMGCMVFPLLILVAIVAITFSSLDYKLFFAIGSIVIGFLSLSGYLALQEKRRDPILRHDIDLLVLTEISLEKEYFPHYIIEMQSMQT